MATPPTIVVVAHARPSATKRLLHAIDRADIEPGTDLIISIDLGPSESETVADLASSWGWRHGDLQVVTHEKIGLVSHFHACGDLTGEHGPIVMLEDDLMVGAGFHRWASAALTHTGSDDRIGGVSLSSPPRDGYRKLPFEPVDDGSDGIYVQVPWYDGMAFTPQAWKAYRDHPEDSTTALHPAFDDLGADEWFPTVTRYLVATNRWWFLPKSSHATGTGACGTHFAEPSDWFQVPLAAAAPSPFRLHGIDDSRSLYDDHLEPSPIMVKRLCQSGTGWSEIHDQHPGPWVVDLNATRSPDSIEPTSLVLTTRPARRAIRFWGTAMHPLIMNVVHDEPGDGLRLAHTEDIDWSPAGDAAARATLRRHHRLGATSRSAAFRDFASDLTRIRRRRRG